MMFVPHLTTHPSNIGVYLRTITKQHVHTIVGVKALEIHDMELPSEAIMGLYVAPSGWTM